MIEPAGDRRVPISPGLAMRVAVLGVIGFALFAIIFFRLWYLQVLSGDQYLKQAQTNQVRRERIEAPRGSIVDRDGNVLVENRLSNVVKLDPAKLPASEKAAVATYGQQVIARSRRHKGHKGEPIAIPPVPADLRARFARLAKVLNMSSATIQDRVVRSLYLASFSPATIRVGVADAVRDYVEERNEDFPGVNVDRVYLRSYPNKGLAAQLVGSVSEISDQQLKKKAYDGIPAGTRIGQSGLEAEYDRYLRGRDGIQRLIVDAQGNLKGKGSTRRPVTGRTVKLSLDLGLQRSAQQAYQSVAGAQPGALVALDPRNGEILAMESFPTFDPSVLSKPISRKRYDAMFGKQAGSPLFNRVTGVYPTGSTFKPITALAALQAGITSPSRIIDDHGSITVGAAKQRFQNAGGTSYGPIDMVQALKVSSDVYFYTMGQEADARPGQIIQTEARKLGLGRYTGIDLPGGAKGVVPDRAWRAEINAEEIACRKKAGGLSLAVGPGPAQAAAAKGCGMSDLRPWTLGDNVNTAVGQGDLQASPLQMADAYAAIANGGTVPRPHLGIEVEDDQGRQLQDIQRPPARHVKIDPAYRQVILEGLHEAASAKGGTSADVFAGWPQSRIPIFGKTGTAEKGAGRADQSWYVAYAYDGSPDHKPIVVAVTAERGGFGAATAAPITCRILAKWFGQKASCTPGKNTTF
jgi:penicillin-binding protein 2